MSIGLATIAALLLLLPGVGFVAGVNFADKNVREIVFRNTPAEIGYVLIVSVAVHLIFTIFVHFNVAELYISSHKLQFMDDKLSPHEAISSLQVSLLYFLTTAVVGFAPGYLLGRMIRSGGKWRFFAKHPWMLDLATVGGSYTVYGRILLDQKFTVPDNADYMIAVEGIVRDSYFAADGTLLYLVFNSFTELRVPLTTPPFLGELIGVGESQGSTGPSRTIGSLLAVEGRKITMARYWRLPIGFSMNPANLGKVEQALEVNDTN